MTSGTSASSASAAHPKPRRYRILVAAGFAVVAAALAALLADKLTKHVAAKQRTTAAQNVVSDKSIAVLPFVELCVLS